MTEESDPSSSAADSLEPSRRLLLQDPVLGAASGDVKHEVDVQAEQSDGGDSSDAPDAPDAPSFTFRYPVRLFGNAADGAEYAIVESTVSATHDPSRPRRKIYTFSASLPGPSRSFTAATSETVATPHQAQLHRLADQLSDLHLQPANIAIDNANMFSASQPLSVLKRRREDDRDEAQQLQDHTNERRIVRMRDNFDNASIAAGNIPENRISSATFFQPTLERSSPPRRRSNALSVPQTTITPCPSDNEEINHNTVDGFATIPNLSMRSRKAPVNPFSAAQSPADSFDGSQSAAEDSQDTSMVTEESQNDMMDMDMDDAPQFSQESSALFNQPANSVENPLLPSGASIMTATTLLQTSRRLPSPAVSDDHGRDASPSTELENFGQMGLQLQGAQQDNNGKWRVPSGSRNMGHVASGINAAPRAKPKSKFTFGYKADCDKCIARVPGHYMHFN